MRITGLFYGSSSGKTAAVANRIRMELGSGRVDLHDVADCPPEQLMKYTNLIMGIPTWGIGELQNDWADFLLSIHGYDLSGKTVALFGLGDQESYPDTFADALGILYDSLAASNCLFTGKWTAGDYEFIGSQAYRDNHFVGLVLDEDNQSHLTDSRISSWLKMISGKLV